MTWRKWKRIEEGGSGFAFGEEIAFAEPMAEGTRGFWFIHGRSIPPAPTSEHGRRGGMRGSANAK